MAKLSNEEMEELVQTIMSIYIEAESRILDKVQQRIYDGIDSIEDPKAWERSKLGELRPLIRELDEMLSDIKRGADVELEDIIQQAYVTGIVDLDEEEKLASSKVEVRHDVDQTNITVVEEGEISSGLGSIHRGALSLIVAEMHNTTLGVNTNITRNIQSTYRRIIQDAVAETLTGTLTRREAAQRGLLKFANRGITTYSGKRNMQISSYVEMATRTSLHEARREGFRHETESRGYDLVRVSDSPDECHLCQSWELEILSSKGKTPGYSTVSEAKSEGLFHSLGWLLRVIVIE